MTTVLTSAVASAAIAEDVLTVLHAAAPAWTDEDRERWWAAATGGDAQARTRLAAHLAATGRDPAMFVAPLPDDPSGVAWAAALAAFVEAQTSDVHPFAAAAAALRPDLHGQSITPQAEDALGQSLQARLADACQLVTPLPAGRGAWLALLRARPALGHVIGVVAAHWRAAYEEMFARLAADRALLAAELWGGADPGPIVGLRADAGDRHHAGRSVALLSFASGAAVVYKPKQLDHVAGFLDVLAFVNAAGAQPPLAGRGVVLRGDYGWEQLVRPEPVATPGDFGGFYRRLGMLARLAQLLAGRDLWADNIVAAGAQPQLIDLECVLAPARRPLPGDGEGPGVVRDLDESVVTTQLLLQPWSAPQDMPILDVGGLTRIGDARRPDGTPLLPLPEYRPFVTSGGTVTRADPWDHFDQVEAGYLHMHELLAAHAGELAAPDGPLRRLRGAWTRHLRRNTWDCYKVSRASVTPAATVSTPRREASLAQLLRMPLSWDDGTRDDLIEIALAEIDGFRALDVPLFGSRTDRTAVLDAAGAEIPDHFAEAAWPLLLQRVDRLRTRPAADDLGFLHAALDAAREGTVRSSATPRRVPARTLHPDLLVAAAAGIARDVLAARREQHWTGQTWHPVTGIRNVEVLGTDLVSGTAGIAVLFAETYRASGDEILRSAALDAVHNALRWVRRDGASTGHQKIAGNALCPGGYYGPGAVAYALAHVARIVHDPSLLAEADELVGATLVGLPSSGPRRPLHDLPTGWAGAALNLLVLRGELARAGRATSRVDARLREVLATLAGNPGDALHAPPGARGRVPSGPESVTMTLARIANQAPDLLARPEPAGPATPTTLSDLLCALDTAQSTRAATPALAPLGSEACTRDLLTHGEILLAARRAGADVEAGLAGIAAALIDGHERTGRWFADRYTDDRLNPGLLDGTGAVALLLLQITDPTTAAPLLLR